MCLCLTKLQACLGDAKWMFPHADDKRRCQQDAYNVSMYTLNIMLMLPYTFPPLQIEYGRCCFLTNIIPIQHGWKYATLFGLG